MSSPKLSFSWEEQFTYQYPYDKDNPELSFKNIISIDNAYPISQMISFNQINWVDRTRYISVKHWGYFIHDCPLYGFRTIDDQAREIYCGNHSLITHYMDNMLYTIEEKEKLIKILTFKKMYEEEPIQDIRAEMIKAYYSQTPN